MRQRASGAALEALFWLLDHLLATIDRAANGIRCFRYGHDFRPYYSGGQQCTRCPEWTPL